MGDELSVDPDELFRDGNRLSDTREQTSPRLKASSAGVSDFSSAWTGDSASAASTLSRAWAEIDVRIGQTLTDLAENYRVASVRFSGSDERSAADIAACGRAKRLNSDADVDLRLE